MSAGRQPAMLCQPFSPSLSLPQLAGCGMTEAASQSLRPKPTKSQICEQFLNNLRQRRAIDLTPEVVEGIRRHFELLPSRYALDVNTSTGLDPLNHARLIDSARADPNAVSFQVRPVEVLPYGGVQRMGSFGALDPLLTAVSMHLLHAYAVFQNAFC